MEDGIQCIEELKKMPEKYYDVILMDAAPSYVFSDAMILSSYADKVLYVVRVDKADAKEIRVGMNPFEEKETEFDIYSCSQCGTMYAEAEGKYRKMENLLKYEVKLR